MSKEINISDKTIPIAMTMGYAKSLLAGESKGKVSKNIINEGMQMESLAQDILSCVGSDIKLKKRVREYLEARVKANEETLEFCMQVVEVLKDAQTKNKKQKTKNKK